MKSIDDRMKDNYERAYRYQLPMRLPVIIRVDGKAFHTFTRDMKRPFDDDFIGWMKAVALKLCKDVQCVQMAYCQSDEISLLLHNYKKFNSESWMGNIIQKMVSVSAGIASAEMTKTSGRFAVFDSRVFVLPPNEVANYFIWRQEDASKNSVQMLARSLYSAKQLHKINNAGLQDLIHKKGQNWNDIPTHKKRGFAVVKVGEKWEVDDEIPVFTKDRAYIERHLKVEEE